MQNIRILCCLVAPLLISPLAFAQGREKTTVPTDSAAGPEMSRLAQALAGDWNTVETMEVSNFFLKGGSRHGRSHSRLAAGGTTLINEIHSDGSAGRLNGFIVIWWDKDANLYRFFTCFSHPGSPCKMRGTAHWEGNDFVNDYEEVVDGKNVKCRDSFINIMPTSVTLVAAMDTGDGTMKTLITTKSTRR